MKAFYVVVKAKPASQVTAHAYYVSTVGLAKFVRIRMLGRHKHGKYNDRS